jgi:hypothetical protein
VRKRAIFNSQKGWETEFHPENISPVNKVSKNVKHLGVSLKTKTMIHNY